MDGWFWGGGLFLDTVPPGWLARGQGLGFSMMGRLSFLNSAAILGFMGKTPPLSGPGVSPWLCLLCPRRPEVPPPCPPPSFFPRLPPFVPSCPAGCVTQKILVALRLSPCPPLNVARP